jgi:hypothetical protein
MITIQTGHILIQATGNHPFYVIKGERLDSRPVLREVPKEEQEMAGQGRWVEARDLKTGDVLMDKSGKGLTITNMTSRQTKTQVHTLDVEDYHNFAIHQRGFLVHNGKKGSPPEPVIFRADHPFLFIIRDKLTGSILFMGRVSDPLTG